MLTVNDVPATSKWIQDLLGWGSAHGGPDFEMLTDASGKVVMWLHRVDADHDHPESTNIDMEGVGQGVIFYVHVDDIEAVRERAEDTQVIEELHFNELARHREFTVKGPEGYRFAPHTTFAGGE